MSLEHVPVAALKLANHTVVEARGNHHAVLGGLGKLGALGWNDQKVFTIKITLFTMRDWTLFWCRNAKRTSQSYGFFFIELSIFHFLCPFILWSNKWGERNERKVGRREPLFFGPSIFPRKRNFSKERNRHQARVIQLQLLGLPGTHLSFGFFTSGTLNRVVPRQGQ